MFAARAAPVAAEVIRFCLSRPRRMHAWLDRE
jgi:hypothetical protein